MSRKKDYRTFVKTHAEGEPRRAQTHGFTRVDRQGEGPLSAKNLERVLERDTPGMLLTGPPVYLNEGESIFQQYPRRIGEGETIRVNEDDGK